MNKVMQRCEDKLAYNARNQLHDVNMTPIISKILMLFHCSTKEPSTAWRADRLGTTFAEIVSEAIKTGRNEFHNNWRRLAILTNRE